MIHTLSGWKKTQLGTPIDLISNIPLKEAQKAQAEAQSIVFVGGVHGDEPEGVNLAKSLLQEINSNKESILAKFFLVPILNPDGYKLNQRMNSNGVDLNRNFPCRNWTEEARAPRYYPGKSPNSELETQALVELVESIQPRLIIHFHSWKPMIVCTSDENVMEAKILSQHTGYKLKNSIGYPTPGSLGDWGWLEHNIPVICTEEKEKAKAEKTWARFGPALKEILSLPR